MLKATQILVRSIALAACAASIATLSGCGQKGPLFLPTDPSAQGHATLPESLGLSSAKKPEPAKPSKAPIEAPKIQPDDEDSDADNAKPVDLIHINEGK
jgi:predicted small lipoprotein YifL